MNKLPQSSNALLIAPNFFGYEKVIAAELTGLGLQVDFLPDRPFKSPFAKGIMRLRPEVVNFLFCDRFFARQIEELGRADYRFIFIIQGEGVTASTLKMLRHAYPRAMLIFYTWDSIDNKPASKCRLHFFDRCLTFDPVDAREYGMSFRPLFYSGGFDRPIDSAYEYDISFIGTLHSDRYKIVQSVIKQLPQDSRIFIHMYLQAPWMYDVRHILTNTIVGAKREEFRFFPLSKDFVQTVFLKSQIILDIEHDRQRGATMRSIEALGSRRKLVTTNVHMQDYDFYNPNNIQIIDRGSPRINDGFVQAPYEEIPDEIRQKYSIRSWVHDLSA